MHTKLEENFIKNVLIIISTFFLFLVVSPYYLYTTDQLYHPLLDYSSFIPSSELAGWDTKLLIFETTNSPFSPLLIELLELYKNISNNNIRLYQVLYKLITLFSIYICINIIIKNKKNNYSLLLIFIYIISYQLIHELERGQWNLISIFLVYCALIYRNQEKYILSIILFSISIQIKVFPLIFAILFLYNKNNKIDYKYLINLIAINTILLFTRGYDGFISFMKLTFFNGTENPGAWEMNPAIKSVIIMMENLSGADLRILLILIIIGLFFTILITYHRTKTLYNEPYSFIALSTLAILLIPKSYDYRLSIVIIPIVYFFNKIDFYKLIINRKNRILLYLIIINFLFLSIKTPSIYFSIEQVIKHLHIGINYHNVDFIALIRSRTIPLITITILFFILNLNYNKQK
jgi:hypothetical protein